jgi:hypothetical protein
MFPNAGRLRVINELVRHDVRASPGLEIMAKPIPVPTNLLLNTLKSLLLIDLFRFIFFNEEKKTN